MIEQIRNLRKKLESLGRKELRIRAGGRYPNKYRTEVQKVAKWQNDGTDRGVTPARFVEKAASARGNWQRDNAAAVWDFLTGGGDVALIKLGLRISADIAAACDRVKTGRLKSSFNPEIKTR